MSDKTSIEWTEATWNPVRGCSRVSPGCVNCYAERVAARFSKPGQPYHGLARMTPSGPHWTGDVRLVEEHLNDPLKWRRPRRIFVNSMSDLFHEGLTVAQIVRVFQVMSDASQHVFQVLTKRPERMHMFMTLMSRFNEVCTEPEKWPLPNVWLGVSVEDQRTADGRIPTLLATPAAVRFVSAEPLLGPVDLSPHLNGREEAGAWPRPGNCVGYTPPLDWVIVGGESGPGARPFDVQWAREIIGQCRAAGVPCFMKQLGAHPFYGGVNCGPPNENFGAHGITLSDRKGGDINEWDADLRVREFPTVTA